MENRIPAPVTRPETLREAVIRAVREAVLEAALPPGERVNEIRLAGQLGVSPTPLREALLSLQHEEFLLASPNRGFTVAPLRLEEAEEIAQLLAQLESAVWRLHGPPPEPQCALLERLALRLAQSRAAAAERQQLEHDWRSALTAHARNGRLLRRIGEQRFAWLRYERAYLRAQGQAAISTQHLGEIAAALRQGEIQDAARSWQENQAERVELMRSWLKRPRSAEPRKA